MNKKIIERASKLGCDIYGLEYLKIVVATVRNNKLAPFSKILKFNEEKFKKTMIDIQRSTNLITKECNFEKV